VNHNSDIPKRNNSYGTDANTRRDADQWKRDNAYSEQVEKILLMLNVELFSIEYRKTISIESYSTL